MSSRRTKKKEFSKKLCVIVCAVLILLGIFMVVAYYWLINQAIKYGSTIVPDAALPIAGITSIFAPIVSYLLYQFGLKNSRNKYKIDEDGQPVKQQIDENGDVI